MNRLLKLASRIFLWSSPVTALLSIGAESLHGVQWLNQSVAAHAVVTGILIAWILSGLVLFGLMTFSAGMREQLLVRLARIRERDEREEMIVGRAARASFLLMLTVLLGLGMLSTFRYGREIGNGEASGKTVTLGHWSWLEQHPPEVVINSNGQSIEQFDIPLSKTGLIGCFILLQLGSFWVFARRSAL
jgi:hypothetical protein